jgi:hypothetical protein
MSHGFDHPSEDLIALHAYGEGSDGERDAIAGHLARCAECRQLTAEFTAFRDWSSTTEAPDPGADFEARMWERIQPSLPARAAGWSARNVAMVASWAAAILCVVITGSWWMRSNPATAGGGAPAMPPAAATDVRERVLFTALDSHLGQTEMLLVELMNAPEAAAELAFERAVADDLVHSGRLYRQTATETGHGLFSAVLDEIEPVLVEVARAPDTFAPGDLAALRSRIVEGDLLFKVRAAARGARDRQHAGEL